MDGIGVADRSLGCLSTFSGTLAPRQGGMSFFLICGRIDGRVDVGGKWAGFLIRAGEQ